MTTRGWQAAEARSARSERLSGTARVRAVRVMATVVCTSGVAHKGSVAGPGRGCGRAPSARGDYLGRVSPLGPSALAVLARRYLLRGDDGQPIETPEALFRRVAQAVALAE